MSHIWRLDTKAQTLVLATPASDLPSVVYWGASLPQEENLSLLLQAQSRDVSGGTLDENPALSICPEASKSFPGQAGLILRASDGRLLHPRFSINTKLTEYEASRNLKLVYEDASLALTYTAFFRCHQKTGLIVAEAEIESSNKPIFLDWLAAPVVPAPDNATHIIDFAGRWCGEFQKIETKWQAGIRYRDNRTGRTGHEHFPGAFLPHANASQTQGSVYGLHYGWSGGHRMIAEQLADGRRQIQFGHALHSELSCGNLFKTAPLYLAFSLEGINGCARSFQRFVKELVLNQPQLKNSRKNPKHQKRPVHYNCWEAVYFKHKVGELKDIATLAAELGAERFVLDDGWFGTRDDDSQSLGDWSLDARKYPDGLAPLIEHVHQLGMDFGLWFEPEMISPNSEVYRKAPHWALGEASQVLGRGQKVLDMTNREVQDYLFSSISKMLSEYAIDYVKWDHNRVLPYPSAEQTRATYQLLDRLNTKFPHVEIESCASGGGRLDFGILARTQRVWLSDTNDALERARIQHNAALFLPGLVTGSHVGPRQCHTTGRIHDMRFRAWIAAQRHLGFEMDPRELSDVERQQLKTITAWWKAHREWLMQADILCLETPDDSLLAEQHMHETDEQFIVFVNKLDSGESITSAPIQLVNLNPSELYELELLNREEAPALSRGSPLLKYQSMRVSGQYLMHYGVHVPWSFPCQTWVLKGQKLHNNTL